MFWSCALPCLLLAAPAQAPAASSGQAQPTQPRVDPPVILSPQPGDTVGSSITVTGTSACFPVMLQIDPPGGYVEVTAQPDGRSWTHTFNNVTAAPVITACCKSQTHPNPPHGPCSSATGLIYASETMLLRGVPPGTRGIPAYPAGKIDLKGMFPYYAHRKQSVHVLLEPEVLTTPHKDRKKPDTEGLDLAKKEWEASFNNVKAGLYVVRTHLISRGAPTEARSWVIRVE